MITVFILKLAIAVGVVIALTLVAEYGSVTLAGILSAYPLGTAMVLFFLGYEISPVFAADSAVFALPGFIGLLMFLTAYWRMSLSSGDGPFGIALCAIAGCVTFIGVSAVLQALPFDLTGGALAAIAAMIGFGLLFRRIPGEELNGKIPFSPGVMVFRAGVVAGTVIFITALAHVSGPEWGGLLSSFPITMFPFLLVLHLGYGAGPVRTVIKNVPLGLGAVISYVVGVAVLYPDFGIGWGTLAAFAVSTLYLIMFLTLRAWIKNRTPPV